MSNDIEHKAFWAEPEKEIEEVPTFHLYNTIYIPARKSGQRARQEAIKLQYETQKSTQRN